MNDIKYDTLIGTLQALKNRGYTSSFKLKKNKMFCLETGKSYSPKNMNIKEYYRFEGNSNPSDMSILFAIDCDDGNKGTIISPYGIYADKDLVEFMSYVQIKA